MKGKVVWFNDDKGYGFIEDSKGRKYFAHFSEIETSSSIKKLKQDQIVTFKPEKSEIENVEPVARQIEIDL